jgi:nitroimidazol reductase NimA-like FMN-containing flavoprotein (pyridoxamine 5'-phosphate oxidase superfamily)
MQPNNRTKVKRVPGRGKYDLKTIYSILDAYFVCHIGFIFDDYPVVMPTLYGREGNRIYIHGANSSRMLKTLQEGIEISAAVTLVDGLVLARSAFHHSMNYRSVVLFGHALTVNNEQDKLHALKVISDQVMKGRWEEVRLPNLKELKATTVLTIPIQEASAKIRTGPPLDEKEDYDLAVWAGELPTKLQFRSPVKDPLLKPDIPLSESLDRFLLEQ